MQRFTIPLVIAFAFVLGLVVNSSGWQEEKPAAKVTKWEIARANQWGDAIKLADEGWELVGGVQINERNYEYLFKRPKQ